MTTEKRFFAEFDKEYNRFYDDGEEISMIEVVLLLNGLHEENTHIKNTITEMYENERTELGKSVLKQLMEQIK
jgi:hypothetical protein